LLCAGCPYPPPSSGALRKNDGDESRRILDGNYTVQNIARQKEQLPRKKYMTRSFGCDIDLAFDALNRDLAGHFVRWERLTGGQHKADKLELRGLEQGGRLLAQQMNSKRLHIDCFAGAGVNDCHGDFPLLSIRRTSTTPRRPAGES